VTLAISILSLVLGATALGWNIYREVVLRGQVKTTLAIGEWHSPGGVIKEMYITAANRGPGPVQLQGFTIDAPKDTNFDVRYHVLPVEWEHPMTTRFPRMLAVGEEARLVVKYCPELFLAGGATRVGLTDTFGRTHWTPRRDGRRALEQFKKDFPAV
jgi:hypothetical protein